MKNTETPEKQFRNVENLPDLWITFEGAINHVSESYFSVFEDLAQIKDAGMLHKENPEIALPDVCAN